MASYHTQRLDEKTYPLGHVLSNYFVSCEESDCTRHIYIGAVPPNSEQHQFCLLACDDYHFILKIGQGQIQAAYSMKLLSHYTSDT